MTFQVGPFTPTLSTHFDQAGCIVGSLCTLGLGGAAIVTFLMEVDKNPNRPTHEKIRLAAIHILFFIGSLLAWVALFTRGSALSAAEMAGSITPKMIQQIEAANTVAHIAAVPLFFASAIAVFL